MELSAVTMDRYITENRAIWDFTLERVRRELETMDCAMAINVISSLGGGTGSGLGTKIV
jgi:cell division GTPase FtsZ